MQRKISKCWIRALLLITRLIFAVNPIYGQNPTLMVNNNNDLINGVSVEQATISSSCLLTVAPVISVKAMGSLTNTVNSSKTIPLSKIRMKATMMGGSSLSGISSEILLSTTPATLVTTLAGLNLTSGDVVIKFWIDPADMLSYNWEAGTYTTTLQFTMPGGTLCLGTATINRTLTVQIASFNTLKVNLNPKLTFASLSDYSNGVSTPVSNQLLIGATSSYNLNLRASKTEFNADAAAIGNHASAIPVLAVNAGPATGQSSIGTPGAINLTSVNQSVMTGAPFVNQKNVNMLYKILPANTGYFIAAGTYSVPLYFSSDVNPATIVSSVTVEVKDISAIVINDPVTELAFNTVQDYRTGISVLRTNHIKLSRTSGYNLYVRASSGSLTNGISQIPVDLIRIEPVGQSNGSSAAVNLSSSSQAIISGATAAINNSVNVRYSIAAANVTQLLNKASGVYSVNITYSFVAE